MSLQFLITTQQSAQYLYHYTSDEGLAAILKSQELLPSRQEVADAQWGDGQYFTDISPEDTQTRSAHQLSRALFTTPWHHKKVRHWLKIDVSDLTINRAASVFSRTYGQRAIYVHLTGSALSIAEGLSSYGVTPFKTKHKK